MQKGSHQIKNYRINTFLFCIRLHVTEKKVSRRKSSCRSTLDKKVQVLPGDAVGAGVVQCTMGYTWQ